MKFSILLFLTGLLANSFAQEITVVNKNNKVFKKLKADTPFHFVEPGVDTSQLTLLATLKVTPSENKSVEAMYNKVSDHAKKMGANAFRLKDFDEITTTMIIEIFNATDKGVEQIASLSPTNVLYIFAGEKNEITEYYNFELNGAPKSIKNGTYYKHVLAEGEQVKLKKGTVSGTTLWIKWKPNQSPHYLSIHGFYNEPVVARTTVSQSFKPGKFLPIEQGLGKFLVAVLKPAE
jgi:hypothetical protein